MAFPHIRQGRRSVASVAARVAGALVLALALLALQAPRGVAVYGAPQIAGGPVHTAFDRALDARAIVQVAAKSERQAKLPGFDVFLVPPYARDIQAEPHGSGGLALKIDGASPPVRAPQARGPPRFV